MKKAAIVVVATASRPGRFTAKMIVSSSDISSTFPGVNMWVQGVGCGIARAVNFSR